MEQDTHLFQGVRQGSHQIRQLPEYLWDAHNIRITDRGDNTLLSISNERGTEELLSYEGIYTGHCVIGKFLVVFTAEDDGTDNRIYRTEVTDKGFKTVLLYHFKDVNTDSWSPKHPILTIGNYETSLIQKVYWTDGQSQPKVINIVKPEYLLDDFDITDGTNFLNPLLSRDEETGKVIHSLYPEGIYKLNDFSFVLSLRLIEEVEVTKIQGNGLFAPGTIQYAFSYFNKYGQESNIFYITPIQYISYPDRGANAEDKVANSFMLQIRYPDDFDYIRIYSIHRTSIDSTPTVKVVEDILNIYKGSDDVEDCIQYVDTGTKGYTVDPTQLLYTGGVNILANTMTAKDGTLFLGNITIQPGFNIKNIEGTVKNSYTLEDYGEPVNRGIEESTYYSYDASMSQYDAKFKSGEVYRLGIQFQDIYGRWTEPIFLEDSILTESFIDFGKSKAVKLDLSSLMLNHDFKSNIKRARTCIVFPYTYERNVVCQGLLCPTVFNVQGRTDNSIYAMSSWFFRPAISSVPLNEITNIYAGAPIEYRHNRFLSLGKRGQEIQGMKETEYENVTYNPNGLINTFYVDENIVTFHSPDLEFDNNLKNFIWDNTRLDIIGIAKLGAISGDISLKTKSVSAAPDGGFHHLYIGYLTRHDDIRDTTVPTRGPDGSISEDDLVRYNNVNGGLVSGFFYRDSYMDSSFDANNTLYTWMLYPWQKTGSINNDRVRAGSQSSVLENKIISNLKFFDSNVQFSTDKWGRKTSTLSYEITIPQLFDSDEIQLLKIKLPCLGRLISYMGNMDHMIYHNDDYDYIVSDSFNGDKETLLDKTGVEDDEDAELSDIKLCQTRDSIRFKYKSSPHLVFSLQRASDELVLLPRIYGFSSLNNTEWRVPSWLNEGLDTGQYNIYDYNYDIYRAGAYVNDIGTDVQSYNKSAVGKVVVFYTSLSKDPDTNTNKSCPLYIQKVTKVTGEGNKKQVAYELVNDVIIRLDKNSFDSFFSFVKLNQDTLDRYDFLDKEELGGGYVKYKPETVLPWLLLVFPGTIVEDFEYEKDSLHNWFSYTGDTKFYRVLAESDDNGVIRQRLYPVESLTDDSDNPVFKYVQDSFYASVDDPYMLIGEIVKTDIIDKFGGTTPEALLANMWLPAGKPVNITKELLEVIVPYEYGDTWYSRYDCLKTYPFTPEDENQIVEIGSFLCETRINIDGRWDKNRGLQSNLTITPLNFNLLNDIYSLRDNFFNYNIYDKDFYKISQFTNQVTWSKEKSAGETTDTWTNLNVANTLDLDGERGEINALAVYNDLLLCFQNKRVNEILFNKKEQINVLDGVPIEISNGYKVSGSRTLLDNAGCDDFFNIIVTSSGLYMIDPNSESIMRLSDKWEGLSVGKGMSKWIRDNKTSFKWIPDYVNSYNGIRIGYDYVYGDVYFIPGLSRTLNDALVFSEHLLEFTGTMSYGGNYAMFNLGNLFCSLRDKEVNNKRYTVLYSNGTGDYNDFYGELKDWYISFISNANSGITKIFDTIEFKGDIFNKDAYENWNLVNQCPFSYIKVSNEYLDTGEVSMDNRNTRKKFGLWRNIIPRSSRVSALSCAHLNQYGVDRQRISHGRARIRNPWAEITLGWKPRDIETLEELNGKVLILNVNIKYTV